jgi:gliding motility-associated-like protein
LKKIYSIEDASKSLDGVDLEIDMPSCFGVDDGRIKVKDVYGGKPPYQMSLDGSNFNLTNEFRNLAPGSQRIFIRDGFGCTYDTLIVIGEHPELKLLVLKDTTILLGQTAPLIGVTNVDTSLAKQIEWMPSENVNCPQCLLTFAQPLKTTRYKLHIIDVNGCEIADELTITVITEPRIYIPDAFTPNGDNINDIVSLITGEDVLLVNKFEIYDRWGNRVFGSYAFDPKVTEVGWDGTLNGSPVNSGVFVYFIEAVSISGKLISKSGDLTLIR